jgi:hypothetical protein
MPEADERIQPQPLNPDYVPARTALARLQARQ